ncbi:putative mRNA-capping enzyme [Apostichopus japonicus]|uniref:mRNA-capping enzyme n=1 Tax=Stichopus japonicus TaxID=307972 RepID=A0A2G8KPI0_STIJA|nr:putative mRNA-capping enzyme [Apostichopus japonicus]
MPTDRWLKCPRKGQLIAEKFLPFKTPLSSHYDSKIPEEDRFYLQMIFAYVQSKQRKVGLVVDLTNTSRFYDKSEVEKTGAKYIKLQCRGHGEAPSRDQTKTFIQICNNFSVQHPQDVIGVHCTHGFNRSGFLICAYLVEKMDWSIDMAVQIFAQARPPGIYKGHYIKDLFKQYGDVNDATPPPELPDWCTEADDEDEESPSNGGIPSASPSKGRNRDAVNENKVFMEGVKGVEIVTEFEKLTRLRRKVERMCGFSKHEFPGCQPVSMDMQNIGHIQQMHYKVSWKADGLRYMLLIDGARQNYFFDRDHTIFSAPVFKFPKRKSEGFLSDTLVDGGEEVGKMNYDVRLQCIQKEIINVRHEYMQKGWINKQQEPFSIRRKEFWDITKTKNILTGHFSKQISHETDGLIFQPFKEPYFPGRCRILLKWKPPSQNSVDFRLVITEVQATGCLKESKGLLYVNHMKEPFAQMPITNALKKYNKKIVECKFDQKEAALGLHAGKNGQELSNAYTTAVAVCQSIMKPVTKDKLLDFIENHAMKPKRPDPGGTLHTPQTTKNGRSIGAGMMDGKLMLPTSKMSGGKIINQNEIKPTRRLKR